MSRLSEAERISTTQFPSRESRDCFKLTSVASNITPGVLPATAASSIHIRDPLSPTQRPFRVHLVQSLPQKFYAQEILVRHALYTLSGEWKMVLEITRDFSWKHQLLKCSEEFLNVSVLKVLPNGFIRFRCGWQTLQDRGKLCPPRKMNREKWGVANFIKQMRIFLRITRWTRITLY